MRAKLLRRAYLKFRKMFFTRERPDGPFHVVDTTPEEVRKVLGTSCYGPNWVFSYNFKGEIINLARPIYNEKEPKGIKWWQVHVRGWTSRGGLLYLRAHYEPEPTQHPSEHLDGVGYSTGNAMKSLKETLESGGITVKETVEEANEF